MLVMKAERLGKGAWQSLRIEKDENRRRCWSRVCFKEAAEREEEEAEGEKKGRRIKMFHSTTDLVHGQETLVLLTVTPDKNHKTNPRLEIWGQFDG